MSRKGRKGKQPKASKKERKASEGKGKPVRSGNLPCESKDVVGGVPRSLVNHGNTCFFNSVLQSLMSLRSFREAFTENSQLPEGTLTQSFLDFVRALKSDKKCHAAVSPGKLLKEVGNLNPRFKERTQEDSHELFRTLLNGLIGEERAGSDESSSTGDSNGSTVSYIEGLFRGTLCSTVLCTECGSKSAVREPFLDLSVALSSAKGVGSTKAPVSPPPQPKNLETEVCTSKHQKKKKRKKDKVKHRKGRKYASLDSASDHDILPSSVAEAAEEDPSRAEASDADVVSLFNIFEPEEGEAKEEEPEDTLLPTLFEEQDDTESLYGDLEELSLEVDSKDRILSDKNLAALQECLARFLDSEIMDGDNKLMCETCTKQEKKEFRKSVPRETGSRASSESEKTPETFSDCSDTTVGSSKSLKDKAESTDSEDTVDREKMLNAETTAKPVYTKATKTFSLESIPDNLVIQLNRFYHHNLFGAMKKLDGFCEFPIVLDMSPFVNKGGDQEYRLAAVICHSGTMRSGHYIAYVRRESAEGELWFYCSDSNIKLVKEREVLESRPYMFFYELLTYS